MPISRQHWIQQCVAELFRRRIGWRHIDATGRKVQTGDRSGRISDLLIYLKELDRSAPEQELADRPDLVVEVVSPGRRQRDRDLVEKRREYAAAGVPEYWIVDPEEECIVVLHLASRETEQDGDRVYAEEARYGRGDQAVCVSLDDFTVDVSAVLDEGQGIHAVD